MDFCAEWSRSNQLSITGHWKAVISHSYRLGLEYFNLGKVDVFTFVDGRKYLQKPRSRDLVQDKNLEHAVGDVRFRGDLHTATKVLHICNTAEHGFYGPVLTVYLQVVFDWLELR